MAGNVWSGKAWRGVAVVATCDKARLGWQGWAVMEGRGLIGVRKSRRSRLGSVCSGASGYGKPWFGGAAQGGLGGVRHRSSWLGGHVMVRFVVSGLGAVLGVVTQTSKIVRKLCGGKTNGLFLEENEAADYG